LGWLFLLDDLWQLETISFEERLEDVFEQLSSRSHGLIEWSPGAPDGMIVTVPSSAMLISPIATPALTTATR